MLYFLAIEELDVINGMEVQNDSSTVAVQFELQLFACISVCFKPALENCDGM